MQTNEEDKGIWKTERETGNRSNTIATELGSWLPWRDYICRKLGKQGKQDGRFDPPRPTMAPWHLHRKKFNELKANRMCRLCYQVALKTFGLKRKYFILVKITTNLFYNIRNSAWRNCRQRCRAIKIDGIYENDIL